MVDQGEQSVCSLIVRILICLVRPCPMRRESPLLPPQRVTLLRHQKDPWIRLRPCRIAALGKLNGKLIFQSTMKAALLFMARLRRCTNRYRNRDATHHMCPCPRSWQCLPSLAKRKMQSVYFCVMPRISGNGKTTPLQIRQSWRMFLRSFRTNF